MTDSINWLENTSRSLESMYSRYFAEPLREGNAAVYLTERLAILLLERLPPEVSWSLVRLLPEERSGHLLQLFRGGPGDASIGYPDFLERTMTSIGCREDESRVIADAFLWIVAQQFPAEVKARMSEALPVEISSRMNLYTVIPEDAKVA